MSRQKLLQNVIGATLVVFLVGCGAPVVTLTSEPTVTSTLPPAETTPTPEPTLPPIPEMFSRTHEAECGWQQQILGSWSRKMEDQSTETLTFKLDNTLFFTYGDKSNQIRVGTYICEQGGTLKLFTLSYVEGKPEMLLTLRKIEISFPSPDTLMMDVKPINEVWTYERVR